MDQNATALPHIIRRNKTASAIRFLKTHLTGTIVHDFGAIGYLDLLQWSHDSNLSITVLLEALETRLKERQMFPKKLYLQLDNCGRENKNQYVLAFLALLVEEEVFEEIELGFLMKGHTHEDIDQLLSCVSRYLHKKNAFTLQGKSNNYFSAFYVIVYFAIALLQACNNSTEKMKQTVYLKRVYNVKDWLKPFINPLHNHSNPHIFRFRLNKEHKVEMHYKQWHYTPWLPNEKGITLLKVKSILFYHCLVIIVFLMHIKAHPGGKPSLVQPNETKVDINGLKQDLHKFPRTGIPECDVEWWVAFVEEMRREMDEPVAEIEEWGLDSLKKIKQQKTSLVRQQIAGVVPSFLSNLHSEQFNEIPEVGSATFIMTEVHVNYFFIGICWTIQASRKK